MAYFCPIDLRSRANTHVYPAERFRYFQRVFAIEGERQQDPHTGIWKHRGREHHRFAWLQTLLRGVVIVIEKEAYRLPGLV
jgi:hypothetical protein